MKTSDKILVVILSIIVFFVVRFVFNVPSWIIILVCFAIDTFCISK